MKLRKAKIKDVPQIHRLINYFAGKGLMLPRSLNEIYEHIRDFTVIEKNGKIIGCCALFITWNDLAEIKCLAVDEKYQRKGYGTRLVKELHREAKKLGINKIFALTFVPDFFKKINYKSIKKEDLPHKIWSECIRCPFFPNCKEEALIYKEKIR